MRLNPHPPPPGDSAVVPAHDERPTPEGVLRRVLWDQVPRGYKKNFQIEVAPNFFPRQNGHRLGSTVLHGLSQVIKERKRGLLPGLLQRPAMIGDILLVSWRIYVVLQAQFVLERVLRRARRI